jgi:hypothetical protein
MVDLELVKSLRAAGVKMVDFHRDGQTKEVTIVALEFFPKSPLEFADTLLSGDGDGDEALPTDRPPAGDDPQAGIRIQKSLQSIMKNGSVS